MRKPFISLLQGTFVRPEGFRRRIRLNILRRAEDRQRLNQACNDSLVSPSQETVCNREDISTSCGVLWMVPEKQGIDVYKRAELITI